MGRGALAVLAVVAALLNPSSCVKFPADDEEVTISSRPKFRHDSSVHHAKEWIDGPDGHVYQFHVGDQSWLSAREFCLSQNSELVVLRSKAQIDWLLTHYAPTYARFNERYMQIGLMMPDGPNRDWTYLDGSRYNQSVIPWLSGEPFDHSADGRERCAIMRVHARVLDDIDCEAAPSPNVHMRFVCERDQSIHKQQQKSQNFIWSKLEKLLEYFGFSTGTVPLAPPFNQSDSDEDYFDELKKMKITSKEREELKNIKIDRETSSEEQRAVETALKVLNKVSKPGTTATSSIPEVKTSRPTSQEDRPNTSSELLTGPTTSSSQTQESNAVSETSTVAETTEAPPTVTDTPTVTTEGATIVEHTVARKTVVEHSGTAKNEAVRARAAPLKEISETEASGAEVEKTHIEDSSKLRHEIDPEKLEKIITTMEKMIENLEKVQVKEVKKEEGEAKEEEKKEDAKKEGLKKKEKSSESLVRIGEKVKDDAETMSAMEKDFDEEANKKLPSTDIKPPEEDCDEEASGEKATAVSPTEDIINNTVDTEDVDDLSQKPKIPAEKEAHIQDFLNTLRTFLSRAEHSDLRKLLDEHPEKTLLEKMKLAIKAANEREFERLKELEMMKKHGVDISHVPEPKLMGENEREELYKKISRVVMVEAEKKGEETVTQPSARTTTQELHRAKIREVRSKEVLIRKSSKEFVSKDKADEKLKDVTPISNEEKPAGQKKEEKVEEKKEQKKEENVEKKKEEKKVEKANQIKKEKKEQKVEEKKEGKKEEKDAEKKEEDKEEKVEQKKEDKKEEKVDEKKEEQKKEKVEEKKEEKTEKKAEEKEDLKVEDKKEEKKEEGTSAPTEAPAQKETSPAAKSSAEIPARTVQLKEFDNKEEIMSKESKPDVKESGEVKQRMKIEDNSEDEEEKPKDDKDFVKTEALTTNDLENQGNDESGEEEKKDDDEDEAKEESTSPSETKSNEGETDKAEAGEENEKKEEESSKAEVEEEKEKKEEENSKTEGEEENQKKEEEDNKENKKKKGKNYVKTERMTVDDLRDVDTYQSDEDKKTEPEESRDGDDEQEKPKLGKNYVKTERLSPKDLKNQPDDSDEAKEVSDEDGDEPKEVSAYPPDPNSEPQDNDDDGDLTQDNNDSFDSEHVDKSNMDNSFDSDQVDRSLNILDTKAHTEPFEESVSTVRMPVEEDEDKGVEVGTEKTPEARRAEKRRLEKAKRKKDRVAKDAPKPKSTADDPDDPDDADTSDPKDSVENPFNLPTLPTLPTLPPPGHPPPTLPPITPMPGLDNLLQTISAQWRQIFPNARIPTFKPDE
ncbi:hypothetical protein Y032_0410g952 [Ancylostoma ceylanicum]|uniref:C-type lectin domain-containing protein n=1 Tax=Ancylostoma ceylanicum TaxID=53326 RepID=A0A016X2L7_9BILA|nr:hypothetical protein Y032_0410g952 [Ancylostoma ceylanicum]